MVIFTDANESALLILGISLEQLLGLTAFEPMWGAIKEDGSDFPVEEYPITLSFKEGITLNNIIMGVHKPNGELIWTTINSKPICNPLNNEIIGSVASFKDITHQKAINDDLDRNLKLLEESQSISKLGGWELDLITGNLYWTAETYRLHETIPEEFNPTVDAGVGYYLPESKVILVKALELATTVGTGYDLYLQTYTAKGNLMDVRTTCRVTMVDGKPIKLTGIFQDITEQKKGEVELQKLSERLVLATRAGGVGIWDLDIVNNHLIWDDQMYKLYGISESEFVGAYESWANAIHPNDKYNSELALELALNNEKEYSLMFRVIWKDNSIHYIQASAQIYRDDSGKPIRMVGTNWEITELINAQNKILKTEKKYKTVVATLHEGIAIHDENLSITEANKSAEEILGLTLDQMQGRITVDESWKTIREDGSEFTGNTRPAMITLQTGKTLTDQIMGVYKPNGNLTWISINTVPMYGDGSDKPNGVLASFKDIIEQKTLELNLKNEKEKYKLLFDNNPMPISVFDAETLQYLNVNEAFCEKYGYSLEEILKLTILDIRPKEEIDSFLISIKPNVPGLVNVGIYTHQKRNKELIKVEIIRHEIIYEGRRAKLVLANDVTEKLKIEEEIIRVNKSALDFKNAVYSASIISKTNIEGNIILVNQNFIEISGYSESELIGKNHRMINSGFHKKEFWAEMWSTVLSGRTWRNEVKNRAKNGTYYWVDTFIIPFINSDGEVTQLLSIRNDITIRKKIEEELILNKKAVESSLEGIVIADVSQPDFPLIYINDRFTELTGYTKEDAIGNNCRFLQGPGSVGETLDRLRKAIKDKKDFEGELINYKKDGTKFWNNLRITTIKNAEGEVTHFVGLQNDITIRKNIEEELILNKKAVESSLEGIAISDSNQPDFPLIYINDRFTELTGYTKEDSIGKNSRFLQGPDSAGETLDRLRKAIVEKNDFEGELINYKKDGTKFWNHLRITTIKNAKGKVTNHVFFQNDITIRKNNEMLLIERGKSLEDIFNFSPVPFVIAKISNGEIIMVNNSLVKLLGENANDLIGKFTDQFYVSKIDKNEILKEIEETGELNNIDLILKTTTGEEIECLTSSK